jgi:site-specific DNA-methyltransferase (adenine-specific)
MYMISNKDRNELLILLRRFQGISGNDTGTAELRRRTKLMTGRLNRAAEINILADVYRKKLKDVKKQEDMLIQLGKITACNADCMDIMKQYSDKYFDLAIVDPPYGIGKTWRKDPNSRFYSHKSSYNNSEIPTREYFDELFRVSENQIIWGGNYFADILPVTNSWIFWDKDRDVIKQLNSEGELAWTSFKIPMRKIKMIWNGFARVEKRAGFHPHEKPVKLYKWLLLNYAKEGDKILDTHGGSFSIAIACHDSEFELVITEKDKEYFDDAVTRLKIHQMTQPIPFKIPDKVIEQELFSI